MNDFAANERKDDEPETLALPDTPEPVAPPESADTSTPEPTPAEPASGDVPPPAAEAPSLPPCPYTDERVMEIAGEIVAFIASYPATSTPFQVLVDHFAARFATDLINYAVYKLDQLGAVLFPEDVFSLTRVGWHILVERQRMAASAVEKRLRCELTAHKTRVQREHELADEVRACQSEVDAAKEEVAAAKGRLAKANEDLAAFVRGEVQVEAPQGKQMTLADAGIAVDGGEVPGTVTAFEQGFKAFDPDAAAALNPYPADPQRAKWDEGYAKARADYGLANAPQLPAWAQGVARSEASKWGKTSEDLAGAILEEGARAELRRGEGKLSVVDSVVTVFERPYLVWDADEDQTLFLILPLYDKDEWQQLQEATYGRCVDTIDQSEEAKAHRQQGGEFCGRAVKISRKKLYIGPMKDALVLTADSEPVVVVDENDDKGEDDDNDD